MKWLLHVLLAHIHFGMFLLSVMVQKWYRKHMNDIPATLLKCLMCNTRVGPLRVTSQNVFNPNDLFLPIVTKPSALNHTGRKVADI